MNPTVVVFDVGNVLIRWDPRFLYRKLLPDEAAVDHFLATVCTQAWNLEQDRGRTFAEAVTLLCAQHPEHSALIHAFNDRWQEMVPGTIPATVDLLAGFQAKGVRTFAITNFSAEKFAETRVRFPFLDSFEGVVVSAHERLVKPDPAIYRLFLERYDLAASSCVFIDDSAANVAGARSVGMHAIHFEDPATLSVELHKLSLSI
jgi:2-haloacid dehalogenase